MAMKLGFEQIRRKNGRFWKVAERPQCDIDSSIPDIDHSEKMNRTCLSEAPG